MLYISYIWYIFTYNLKDKVMKTVDCPRCGGSGKTEHTHIVYGVCFLCKGSGSVTEATFVLTEEKKQAKEAKKLEAKKQAEIEEKNRWIALHNETKAKFENQVNENSFDLNTLKSFRTCIAILNHKNEKLTKETFEASISDFGNNFYINNRDCRLALVKFCRRNNIFNSKFEYQNDSYDFNEYRYL